MWTGSDFAFAAVLLFVPLGVYEWAVRKTDSTAYRSGVVLALAGVFAVLWISAAVGITDSAADGLYVLALAGGLVGAVVARFRPRGLARAMVATALGLGLAGVIALVSGAVPAYNSPLEILGLSGFFALLFIGSALLFQTAAGRPGEA